jgi:D-alanyl-D-alanine carboxypeptidase/D-alanyl-D-alanine-endopeptidase (penicillin-binding protein 4)
LVSTLESQGISVAQAEISEQPSRNMGAELATVESPSLGELLVPTNQNSNNLYAEVLLKTLGVTDGEPPIIDASAAGGEVVAEALGELGVNSAHLRLADGSGLSRHNLVTPEALVATLQAMALHPEAEVFLDSLAVAGVSGTLRNRLDGTILEGRVQGKSGALTGNVSLSGYLQPPDYEPLVFSIVVNH